MGRLSLRHTDRAAKLYTHKDLSFLLLFVSDWFIFVLFLPHFQFIVYSEFLLSGRE